MSSESFSSRRGRLPRRIVPLLYFGFAHLALATAFLTVAWEPEAVAGFYYHPRMLFVVHLVTLGWITSSILGALYLVAPIALASPMPAEPADYVSFGVYLLGSSGAIFHFWIDEISGVGLSGFVVIMTVGQVGIKFLLALGGSKTKIPGAVRAHFILAFLNFGLAVFSGILLAFNKLIPFLPGYVLSNVFAHAHLAGLGWATMMVFAAGYRLLPMFLPSAMPRGRAVWIGAATFEIGILGLVLTLFLQSPWRGVFAVLTVVGIGIFLSQVVWMKKHPKPPAKKLQRPDWGVIQALTALAYLGLSCVLGLVLIFSPETEWSVRLVLVYGTCGLLGFLGQIISGISMRLLPIYSWLRASADGPPTFTPHDLPNRRLQALSLLSWGLGVPMLAIGFFVDRVEIVGAAGWVLLAAVIASAANIAWVLRRPVPLQASSSRTAA